MAHAILPPSGAGVWGYCSGSVLVEQSTPDIETEESRAGDAVHWAGAEMLKAWKRDDTCHLLGVVAPNGVVITDEHLAGAEVYVNDVTETLGPILRDRAGLMVEFKVYMPRVHPTLNYGTLDAAARVGKCIYLWDYKNGHSPVEAEGNLQAVDYLEGLRELFKLDGFQDQHTEFCIRIVQPNAFDGRGAVREWRGMVSDIRPYVSFLASQAEESQTNPQLVAGLHCVHCPGRVKCTALRRSNYRSIDMVKLPLLFEGMTGRELATERAILERGQTMIKKRLDAIDEDLTYRLKNGAADTGLALSSVKGRLVWAVEPEQAIAAVSLAGIDIRRPHCLTPAQSRNKVPAAMRDAYDKMIAGITDQRRSTKIVAAKDTTAAKVFGKK